MDLKWLIFCCLVSMAKAEAEAQAEPEAEPQLLGAARPDYYPGSTGGSYPGGSYPGQQYNPGYPTYSESGRPMYNPDPNFNMPDPNQGGYNPDPGYNNGPVIDYGGVDPGYNRPDPNTNTCQMTDQCCQMEQQNCCVNQQRCFTKWERECDDPTISCPVKVYKKCHDVTVPTCTHRDKIEEKVFQTEECVLKPQRKCFKYQAKRCKDASEVKTVTEKWTTDTLKNNGEQTIQNCVPIKEKNCTRSEKTESVRVPKQVTTYINQTVPVCKWVFVPGQGGQETVTIWTTSYKQACYEIDVPICTATPCQTTGLCETGTSPCARDNYQSSTVCPNQQPNLPPNTGCQQVQQPVCNSGGPSCGFNQQCCRSQKKKVCKMVPVRVPKQVTRPTPGVGQYKKVCDSKTYSYPKTTTQWTVVQRTRPVYDCKWTTTPKCYNWTRPDYDVITETTTGSVNITLPKCEFEDYQAEHCTVLPDMDASCKPVTIRKKIRIPIKECKGQRVIQKCFQIVGAICQQNQPNCRMVPRQVCKDTCEENDYCNTCNNFVNQGGFGTCPTATCGNFYGNSVMLRNQNGPEEMSDVDAMPMQGVPMVGPPSLTLEDEDMANILN